MPIDDIFPQGGTNPTVEIVVVDPNGDAVTNLTSASAGATLEYRRPRDASFTGVTLSDLASADAAHSAGGMFELAAGLYRFDLPDAAIASGENKTLVHVKFDASAHIYGKLSLDPDPSRIQGAVVSDAGNSTTQFKTDLSHATDGLLVGMFVRFRSGPNAGHVAQVSAYDGTNKIITVDAAMPATPNAGDEFVAAVW